MYGNQWSITAHVDWIDRIAPTATVVYSTTEITNQNVTVSLSNVSADVENIPAPIVFTANGTNSFTITDKAGNTVTIPVAVNNIDKVAPTADLVYSTTEITNQNVTVSLSNVSADVETIPAPIVFTANGMINLSSQIRLE